MTKFRAEGVDTLLYPNAVNRDIITTIQSNFEKEVKNVEPIAQSFAGPTVKDTAHNVWAFLKQRKYKADGEHQKIKSPARFLEDNFEGIPADCKSYSLFASAIMAHHVPKGHVGFRYVAYPNITGDTTPTHVYSIVRTPSGEVITIDGVDGSDHFNKEVTPILKKKILG